MFDNLHNSDSSTSSFKPQYIKKHNLTKHIQRIARSTDETDLESSTRSKNSTDPHTQTKINFKTTSIREKRTKSMMMCYSSIVNDNPWWKEQESFFDRNVALSERRDETDDHKTSFSMNLVHKNFIRRGREEPFILGEYSDQCIPGGCSDDGVKFGIDYFDKDLQKDGCDTLCEEDGDEDDDDDSSIISSSSSAVFELFEDLSVLTEDSSINNDKFDDEEDNDGFHYFVLEGLDDVSLLTEATDDVTEQDFQVMIFSLVENENEEDFHYEQEEEVIEGCIMIDEDDKAEVSKILKDLVFFDHHEQQEEVVDGCIIIDEYNKANVSKALKDLVLLDFLVGFCSENGSSSNDTLPSS